jgi:hypothetical protein
LHPSIHCDHNSLFHFFEFCFFDSHRAFHSTYVILSLAQCKHRWMLYIFRTQLSSNVRTCSLVVNLNSLRQWALRYPSRCWRISFPVISGQMIHCRWL